MIPPPRTTRRAGTSVWREEPRRVDAARRVEPGDRRPDRERAGGDDRALEVRRPPPPSTAIVFGAGERPLAVDPLDAVRLEQRGDAAGHLVDDGVLPRGDRAEVERRVGGPDAELRERLARVVVGVRALHPRLRRDAPDAQARAAELRLGLDARDLAAQLRGADRRRVAGRPSSENCDVDIHGGNPRSVGCERKLRQHRDRVVVLRDPLEAVALVELDRACIGAVDAQRERRIAVGARPLEERASAGRCRRPCRARSARPRSRARACARRRTRSRAARGRRAGTTPPRPGIPWSRAITAVSPRRPQALT